MFDYPTSLIFVTAFYVFTLKFFSTSQSCNAATHPFSQPPILCLAALTANESDIAALLRREIEEEKKPEPTNLKHVVFGIDATTKLWEQRKNYIKIWYKSDMMRGTVWMDGEVATTADDDLKKELDMWRRSLEGSDEEKC
ncbi:hypothetical protein LINPERHAP1_LOCUS9880 [Linum perenne]